MAAGRFVANVVTGSEDGASSDEGLKDVRLVPVDVVVPAITTARPASVGIAFADVEVRVEVGTDPSYVSVLVAALRSPC